MTTQLNDKAQTILAGALEVFTTQGYAAASMDRIAAAAQVSKPTVYKYFPTKEDLFVAAIEQLTHNTHQILFDLPADPKQQLPPEVVLRHIAQSVLTEVAENRPFLTLMRLVIGESERFPELAQTFVRNLQKPMLERFSHYLASHPQLHFRDPMVTARIFAGSLVHYLIVQSMLQGADILPLERDRFIDGLVQTILAANQNSH